MTPHKETKMTLENVHFQWEILVHPQMLQGSLNVSPILEGSNLMQICGNFDGFPPKKMCIVSVGNIMTSVFLNAKIRYLI